MPPGNEPAAGKSGGMGTMGWVGTAAAVVSTLGNLFSGWAQGKISEAELRQRAQAMQMTREQFEFAKQQALRQNKIADHNVDKISPMMEAMLARRTAQANEPPPRYQRLAPPKVNNPYSPGDRFGNELPPEIGLPGIDPTDPREFARRAAGVR